MSNQAKKCTTCGDLFTLDNFRLTRLSPDGHSNICKACAHKRRLEKRNRLSGGATLGWRSSHPANSLKNSARGHEEVRSEIGNAEQIALLQSIKAYGNAIVPQVVYQIFESIKKYEL